MTVAGTLSVYETVATSSTPSPLGLMTGGWTVTPVSFKAGGFPPIVPVAGRTVVPAEIAQKYLPRARADASHVQSTAAVAPIPLARTAPCVSVTVTVQGSALESRARKRTLPGMPPVTVGA